MRRLLAHKFEHRGRYADYAILYRGNHQAKLFEQQLRAQNVPVHDLGRAVVLRARRDQGPRRLPAARSPTTTTIRRSSARSRRRSAASARRRWRKLGAIAGARHESLFAAVFAPEAAHGAAGAAARDPRRVLHADQRPALPRRARAGGAAARRADRGDRLRGLSRRHLRQAAGRVAVEERARLRRAGCRPRARPTARTCSSSRR